MLGLENIRNCVVLLRGGGDLASGVAQKLMRCGFQVIIKELKMPMVVRRKVSFASAVFEEVVEVEGIVGRYIQEKPKTLDQTSNKYPRVKNRSSKSDENQTSVVGSEGVENIVKRIKDCMLAGEIPIVTLDEVLIKHYFNPYVFIDGTVSKKRIEYQINDYPLMIGIGPDIEAGINADAVIESDRGHHLGKIIYLGEAKKSTGVPGNINGYTHERILRAPSSGFLEHYYQLGDIVQQGDIIMSLDNIPIKAEITGMLRGLIHKDVYVSKNMKIGDIDPRGDSVDHLSISDKSRSIAGAVLEVIMNHLRENS